MSSKRKKVSVPDQELYIDGIGFDGMGTAVCGDSIPAEQARIAGALPGDRVVARLEHFSQHHPLVFGKVYQTITPSPQRRSSPCPHHKCDGCPLVGLREEAQRGIKLDLVKRTLADVVPTELLPEQVEAVAPSLGYRRRAKYIVEQHRGQIYLGAYARRSHRFVSTESCPLVTPTIALALAPIMTSLRKAGVAIASKQPGLRYLQLRSNNICQLLLTLVAHTNSERLQRAARDMGNTVPGLCGVTLDINPSSGDALLSGDGLKLWGQDHLTERISGVETKIDPYTFTQIHGPAGERLSELVSDMVQQCPEGRVADLYSGLGALAFAIAKQGRSVIAVEKDLRSILLGSAAAKKASAAARKNTLNVDFAAMESDHFLHLQAHQQNEFACIVVDPPRRGLGPDAIQSLLKTRSNHLVYVSCNAASLRRDLEMLLAGGYRVQKLHALDLFPQTMGVELVALLNR